MSDGVRVFVNGKGVDVPPGSTLLDAVERADPVAAAEVRAGARAIADSRGIVVPSDGIVSGGYVMRIVSARGAR